MTDLWGIDLGGTKIEGAVVDPLTGEAKHRMRVDTEQSGGYEHILSRIKGLVELLERESGTNRPQEIGLAMPGAIEPSTGRMKNANTVCLIGQPLIRDLSAVLGVHVIGENDANCFALAEATQGAAQGLRVVFGVILGTGVGGGLVIDGRVWGGHHGIAGEWGHNQLIADGEACYCGKRGCVETVLSGPALERWYESQAGVRKKLREIAASDEPAARDRKSVV